MNEVKFSDDLEHAAFGAIAQGLLPLSVLKPEELSKTGKAVHAAFKKLSKNSLPPFALKSVLVTASDYMGGDRESLRDYLRRVSKAGCGREIEEILRAVRDRQTLLNILNECNTQLGNGSFSVDRLSAKLAGVDGGSLTPVSEVVRKGVPRSPKGIHLSKLPELSRVSGGLQKLWVIGGEPGVGKSTLAVQLAVLASQTIPALYYDFENGTDVLVNHLYEAVGKDRDKLRRVTTRLYLRDSIRSLEADLISVPAPALVVVDSVQKLPTRADERRTGLDQWVHRFESLKKRGYTVVLLSELNREMYQGSKKAGKSGYGYKETGEIEYAADFAIELRESRKDKALTEVIVKKNRHYMEKGHITNLERVNKWWFREVEGYEGQTVN